MLMKSSWFQPITKALIELLNSFYIELQSPLADLNAVMMVAWQDVLNLRYYIDDQGILFILGTFCGKNYGWGPPIGKNVTLSHIDSFLSLLKSINRQPSSILYLWEGYSLFPSIQLHEGFNVSNQASEYIYSTQLLAELPNIEMKSLRKNRDYFLRRYKPIIEEYSNVHTKDCLAVLERWREQKKENVPENSLDKFEIESRVCRRALELDLPLNGMVMYIGDKPVGFSLGGKHSNDCFNCMFEKTDLTYNGLSVAIFSRLGSFLQGEYEFVNAGEDWGVEYLKDTKLKWKPVLVRDSFELSCDG